jgi:hypothetical protein
MKNFKLGSVSKYILLPFVVAILIFVVIRPISAQMGSYEERLSEFLLSENVEVGMETVNDRSHVYYVFDGDKKFITEDSNNNRQPSTNGEYITYVKEINGQGQIFLYHIMTSKTVQLTRTGPNQNPFVSGQGKVVWEGWVESGSWQVFVYDGTMVKQVTQGDIARTPSVYKDFVLYTRKNDLGEWRSEVYSLLEDKTKVLSFGPQNKDAVLVEDNITFKDGGVYPLKPADLFLFDISGMEENINTETATPSAEL